MHLSDFITGIIAALAGSAIWIVFLPMLLAPRLEISTELRQYISRAPEHSGQPAYRISVTNKGHRALVDMRYELAVRYTLIASGKRQLRNLVKVKDGPLIIGKRTKKDDGKYGLAIHCDLLEELRAVQQLEGIDSVDLRVRIYVRDELSGVGKVFVQTYQEDDFDLLDQPAAMLPEQVLADESVPSESISD